MNAAHAHLMLTHLPVLGTCFALVLLAFGFVGRSEPCKRSALVALLLCSLAAVPAFLTGEPAAKVLARQSGISQSAVDRHEDIAQLALGGAVGLGVVALAGLALFRGGRPIGAKFATVLLLVALLSAGLMVWTSNAGGLIRHPEIQGGSAP